jgi:hypothetical protein
LYAVSPGGQVIPCFDPVLMMAQGVRWSIIAWVKLCTPLMTPNRLTFSTRRQPSGLSNGPPPGDVPALFISTATSPNAA